MRRVRLAQDGSPSGIRLAAYAVMLFALLGVIGAGARVAWLWGESAPPVVPNVGKSRAIVHVPGGPLVVHAATGPKTVRIRSLDVDRFEVTVAAYRVCMDAGYCKAPPPAAGEPSPSDCNIGDPSRAAHPMNCVSVAEAIAYCEWRGARLPTTSEWMYLAHGSADRPFPWGSEPPGAARLNACGRECDVAGLHGEDDGYRATAPVGAFPAGATPEGLLDMAGNVEEWACDLDPAEEERDDVACWTFAELGGSFQSGPEAWRGDGAGGSGDVKRYWRDGYRAAWLGFRCVR